MGDVHGYNFLPYKALNAMRSRFEKGVATSFTIEWSRTSYASQNPTAAFGDSGGPLDYSLLLNSTFPLPDYSVQAVRCGCESERRGAGEPAPRVGVHAGEGRRLR